MMKSTLNKSSAYPYWQRFNITTRGSLLILFRKLEVVIKNHELGIGLAMTIIEIRKTAMVSSGSKS
jgi:hypothetical protein